MFRGGIVRQISRIVPLSLSFTDNKVGGYGMNFETKYLIRWGIPGWMLIFWITTFFVLTEFENIFSHFNFSDFGKLVGVFISLGVFGIVLGYIVHQLYFVVNWVTDKARMFENVIKEIDNFPKPDNWGGNNRVDYFYLEFIWHKNLLELEEEKRNYIVGRYRYLLSTVHGLGTLFLSHFLSFVFTIAAGLLKFGNLTLEVDFLAIAQGGIMFVILASFKYYSENLNYFQGRVLNAMLKDEI